MLTKRTRGTAAIAGAVLGLGSVSLLAWRTQVAFFYYAIVGTLVTFVSGWLFSFMQKPRSSDELMGLTPG